MNLSNIKRAVPSIKDLGMGEAEEESNCKGLLYAAFDHAFIQEVDFRGLNQ